jgi:hypothetical protein
VGIDLTVLLPKATGVDNYMLNLVLLLARLDHANRYMIFVNRADCDRFAGVLPRRPHNKTRPRPWTFPQPAARRMWTTPGARSTSREGEDTGPPADSRKLRLAAEAELDHCRRRRGCATSKALPRNHR